MSDYSEEEFNNDQHMSHPKSSLKGGNEDLSSFTKKTVKFGENEYAPVIGLGGSMATTVDRKQNISDFAAEYSYQKKTGNPVTDCYDQFQTGISQKGKVRPCTAKDTEYDRFATVFLSGCEFGDHKGGSRTDCDYMKGSSVKSCDIGSAHDGEFSLTKPKQPFTFVCKVGPDCRDHDWNSIRSPVRLVCRKGPGCMNHDWFSTKCPIEKLTRDEIVGTKEQIQEKEEFKAQLEANVLHSRDYGWNKGDHCHDEIGTRNGEHANELPCQVNRWKSSVVNGKTLSYRLKCKKGPGMSDYDWLSKTSPVQLVCKNGPGCKNHDWWNKSVLRVNCKNGPICQNCDWAKFGIHVGNLYDKYHEDCQDLLANTGVKAATYDSGKCNQKHHLGCAVGCHQHLHTEAPKLKKKKKIIKKKKKVEDCECECPNDIAGMEKQYQLTRKMNDYHKQQQMNQFLLTLDRKKNACKNVNFFPYFYSGGPINTPGVPCPPKQFNPYGCNVQDTTSGFSMAGNLFGMGNMQPYQGQMSAPSAKAAEPCCGGCATGASCAGGDGHSHGHSHAASGRPQWIKSKSYKFKGQ